MLTDPSKVNPPKLRTPLIVPPPAQTYTFDPMGNRSPYTEQGTSVAYTKNNANQYTSVVASGLLPRTSNPVYDANGNMLTNGVKNYVRDAENQLVSVTPVAPGSGDLKAEFAYDWRMRRISSKSKSLYGIAMWDHVNNEGAGYHAITVYTYQSEFGPGDPGNRKDLARGVLPSLSFGVTNLNYHIGHVDVRACGSAPDTKFKSTDGTAIVPPSDEYHWPILGGINMPFIPWDPKTWF